MGGTSTKVTGTPSKTSTTSDLPDTCRQPSSNQAIYRFPTNNQSTILGSFYNARLDCLLDIPPLAISPQSIAEEKQQHSTVIRSGIRPRDRLPGVVDMDAELHLSLTLKMTPPIGIALLVDFLPFITNDTGILYYYYSNREKYIIDTSTCATKDLPKPLREATATHVVTKIKTGIHVIVILQSSSGKKSDIEELLEEIKNQLSKDQFELVGDKKLLLDRFKSIKAFSNIPDIAELTKLDDVCHRILQIKSHTLDYVLDYTLEPIRIFCPTYLPEKARFNPINPEIIKPMQKYLHDLSVIKKPWETPLDSDIAQHITKQFYQVKNQISTVEKLYQSTMENIHELVVRIRSGIPSQDNSIKTLVDEPCERLLNEIRIVTERRDDLQEKLKLIHDCSKHGIIYSNMAPFFIHGEATLEIMEQQLLNTNKQKRFFCCDDDLKQQYFSQWNQYYTQLINERNSNSEFDLVYADFSYCKCRLPQMKILSANSIKEERRSSWSSPHSKTLPSSQKGKYSDQNNSRNIDYSNVLLLGESGVGKSTFINAIVNYLHFKTLQEAHSNQPIVAMPVSFLLTVGDHFQEKIVKFGEEDPNEDHEHPGQSVTQHCRSYVFTTDTRTKIRLIDTPGMGDTRGLDQDDRNMQHILSYINNLSHLNAICILLKPNEARLNVVFRSYFTRLLGFLGENVRHNIVFCFTNTRATFFAPGNSGPLLKRMIESNSSKDIPFGKKNTFCFENESFRYLVALLNEIEFDDYQKKEYQQSWTNSVAESNRLIKYICGNLKPYPRENWQSIEHAEFQITQMIRPILETMRNLFRNLILQEEKPSEPAIRLCPDVLDRPSTICIQCKGVLHLYSDFWIPLDKLHIFSNKCGSCACSRESHIDVDYKLDYELSRDANQESVEKMNRDLNQLKQATIDFGCFFVYTTRTSKSSDPISSLLNQMINKEHQICQEKGSKCLNSKLYKKLNEFKEEYEDRRSTLMSNSKPIDLTSIYERIRTLNQIDSIEEQMDAIKQYQQINMSKQETRLS